MLRPEANRKDVLAVTAISLKKSSRLCGSPWPPYSGSELMEPHCASR